MCLGSQKESLGEYGSGWGWDGTYPHAFDQTNEYMENEKGDMIPDDTPVRYIDNGTMQHYCYADVELTNGQILYSGSVMEGQHSCKSNSLNAGNWYSWSAVNIEDKLFAGHAANSICSKGWRLIMTDENEENSFYGLIVSTYGIVETNIDDNIRFAPISLIRSGKYNSTGTLSVGDGGNYWTSRTYTDNYADGLVFTKKSIDISNGNYKLGKGRGFSVRCVSR